MKQPAHLPSLLFLCYTLTLVPVEFTMAQQNSTNTTVQVHVGVVLDLESWVGKTSNLCISMALSDFYAVHDNYTTRLVLHTRDSQEEMAGAAFAAQDLIKNVTVKAIIGAQTSGQAKVVVDLGDKAQIPIVSFSATSPSLTSTNYPNFVGASQSDSDQVKAIATLTQAFEWREVVLIYEDSEYGNGLIPYLTDYLREINVRVYYMGIISPLATDQDILNELNNLKNMHTTVFVVHLSATLGSRLFLNAKEAGMMIEGYAWIITAGIANFLNSMDPSIISSMQGVLGIRPYLPRSPELANFTFRWKTNFLQENPNLIERIKLNIYGLWAYDAVWATALAAERVWATSQELHEALLNVTFKGLSGEFHLVDGRLNSSVFEVVNVIGKGDRVVGYWAPSSGLSHDLEGTTNNTYSISKDNLRGVFWPGESTSPPRGWVIPANGNKLRIAVPMKSSFGEFVKVDIDPHTNQINVTGFSIDVFKSVMEQLPFTVPYEFIVFDNSTDGISADYNNLAHDVYLQKYDAAVGDTTILANRSLYVDFTVPYTAVGVSMIVPIKEDKRTNTWIFLKPLTKDLWLATGAAFIFTGFVVWVLEHRINTDFRGSTSQQVGTTLWFSFSTIVFSPREKVVSNLSRFVVVVWVFVVLILTQSYTASLTSMLTVQQLTIKDVKQLIMNEESVGYQQGSFVKGLLQHLHFDEQHLIPLLTPEDYANALSKGSRNGGVSAIFDEIPYINAFLAQYCDKFAMVGPTYNTDGFGFIFQKGSPLVLELSKVISNATEEDAIAAIEKRWFSKQTTCGDQTGTSTVSSLTLDSFKGLFLITIVSSTFALLLFSLFMLNEYRHVLILAFKTNYFCQMLVAFAKRFRRRGLTSCDMKTEPKNGAVVNIGDRESSTFTDGSNNTYILNHSIVEIHPAEEVSSWPPTIQITQIRG